MLGRFTRAVAFFALLGQLLWPRYLFFQVAGKGVSGYTAFSLLLLASAIGSFIIRHRLRHNALEGMLRSKLLIGLFFLLWAWRVLCDVTAGGDGQVAGTVLDFFYVGSWFISSMIVFADERMRAALPYYMLGGVLIATLFGLLEYQSGTPIAVTLGLAGQNLQLNQFTDELARGGAARIRSVFVHPIMYGQTLGALTPFALFFLLGRGLRNKVLGLVMLASIGLSLLLCNARSPLVVTAVAAIGFMAVYLFDLRRRGRLFFAMLGLAGAIMATPVAIGYLEQLQAGRTAEEASSTTGRTVQMNRGLSAISRSPITGFGYGTAIEYASTTNTSSGRQSVDSYVLSVLVESGYVGFFIFVAMLAAMALQGARAIYTTPWDRERTVNCAAFASIFALVAGLLVVSITDTLSIIFQMAGFLVAASAVPALVQRDQRRARARAEAMAAPAAAT